MRSFLTLCAFVAASALSWAMLGDSEPGSGYCYGVGCPCGNDDPDAGCINSSGDGALLTVTGSNSLAADDLVFTGTQLSKNSVCILVSGGSATQLPFMNGLLCLGSDIKRLQQHQNTGPAGTVTFQDVLTRYSWQNVYFQPGEQRYFQLWFRDTPQGATPCGQPSNLSNGYAVTFTP